MDCAWLRHAFLSDSLAGELLALARHIGMRDSQADRRSDFVDAARRNWRWYAPAWVFPIVLLGGFTAYRAGMVPGLFGVLWMPAYAVAFFLASVPEWRGRASRRESVVLGMLVPFLIWAAGVFVRIVILALAGRSDLI